VTEESRQKRRRLAGYLDARGLDGVVMTRRCNFSWYTCGASNHVTEACDVGVSSLVVTRERAVVVANNIEATRLGSEELAGGIELIEYPYYDPRSRLRAFAEAMGGGAFAADAPLEGLDLPAVGGEFDRLRWQLCPAEIERYHRLCRDAAVAVESAARQARPGMTEHQLAGRLADELRSRGCRPWLLLVGCDERTALHRHPLATDRPAKACAMLVTTAERGGLIAAVTRIVVFGKIPQQIARRHRAVTTVDAALLASTRPGTPLGQAFEAAQRAYAAVGFPEEWRRHHQGGSIGYLPREVKAAPGCDVRALADQAFAWNPSIAGTKCEDTVLCRPGGPEVLTDTGDWPSIEAAWEGQTFLRPDLLRL